MFLQTVSVLSHLGKVPNFPDGENGILLPIYLKVVTYTQVERNLLTSPHT